MTAESFAVRDLQGRRGKGLFSIYSSPERVIFLPWEER